MEAMTTESIAELEAICESSGEGNTTVEHNNGTMAAMTAESVADTTVFVSRAETAMLIKMRLKMKHLWTEDQMKKV